MKRLLTLLAFCASVMAVQAKDYKLTSPDGQLTLSVQTGERLTYSVARDGVLLLEPSAIGLTLENGTVWGPGTRFSKAVRRSVNTTCDAPVFKRSTVKDHYNELCLKAKGFEVQFRAYDDGIAWRFVPAKAVTVKAEEATFAFAKDWKAFIPYVNQHTETLESQFFSSQEAQYTHASLSAWDKAYMAFPPVTVEADGGVKICITESDLLDYPGLYLYNGDGDCTLEGRFARVPAQYAQEDGKTFQRLIAARKDVLAENTSRLPWRTVIVAPEAKDLAQSDFVWRLASPNAVGDISWLKPGKVAWDWWNGWNLYGVDFEAGINTQTYKYYIDFASAHGIEYIVMDEGWAKNTVLNMKETRPEIDLPELVRYGREKGVGVVLWTIARLFEDQMEELCAQYSAMGVKGWKVDFMDHDDQKMVRFYRRAAETAARYHMFVDFHGAYKPTGLQRTYPNVLNFEGVYGLEQAKWDNKSDLVTNEVTIPFIRMVAGPMDYTQGAMKNGNNYNFAALYNEPMSQGTRCRQLAEYVIFESPFNMLCDSPSNYIREDECTQFIASVPTTWDETIVLDGKVGEYLVIARRKDFRWYVGAITNWDERDIELDLSVLPNFGAKSGHIFRDGINANRAARDYVSETVQVMGNKVKVHLAKGGGAVMVF